MTRKHVFPWHISNCGDIDIVGHQKPQSLFRTVLWGVAPMTMAVHHPNDHPEVTSGWGWPEERASWTFTGYEDTALQVRVFARGCETAVLMLNGKRVASSPFQANFTATLPVVYHPGTLKAQCVNDTKVDPSRAAALTTAGAAAALTATPDRARIKHDRDDLSYVTIAVVDTAGEVVPDTAAVSVAVSVTCPGQLLAIGTGDPKDPTSLYGGSRTAWRGRLVAIVQPVAGAAAGAVTLTASAAGLPNVTAVITTTEAAA